MPAGGGGDPHMTSFDGREFDFHGEPGHRYRLYGQGKLAIDGIMTALPGDSEETPKRVFGAMDISYGPVRIMLDTDGHLTIRTPEYDLNVHALGCSLPSHHADLVDDTDPMNGVAYINYQMLRHPDFRPGEWGVCVNGADPERKIEDFEVSSHL